jgi:Beta-eliminating lyase
VSLRETAQEGRAPRQIAEDTFRLADGTWISLKKDGLCNIGGVIALRNAELAQRCRELLIGTGPLGASHTRNAECLALEMVASCTEINWFLCNKHMETKCLILQSSVPNPAGGVFCTPALLAQRDSDTSVNRSKAPRRLHVRCEIERSRSAISHAHGYSLYCKLYGIWEPRLSLTTRQLHVTASGNSWSTSARRRGILATPARVDLAGFATGCCWRPEVPYAHRGRRVTGQRPSILCTHSSSFPWRLAGWPMLVALGREL